MNSDTKDIKVGDLFTTVEGGEVVVLEYKNAKNVKIMHTDKWGHTAKTRSEALRNGTIKNPYMPKVRGVGFIGVGRHKPTINRRDTKAASIWRAMMQRCYSEEYQKRQPTYKGCTIHPDWHNFQNFAEWFEGNYVAGWQLDKDIIKRGNKIYSGENCSFVPRQINSLFSNSLASKGDLPQGLIKYSGMYGVTISIRNKPNIFKGFISEGEAKEFYKFIREEYVRDVAKEWKSLLSLEVYKALCCWEFNFDF